MIALSSANTEPLFPRLARLSGDLSYPIYVLHMPLLHGVAAALTLAGLNGEPGLAGMIFRFGAVMLLSWAALKIYDEPVRRALAPLASLRAH
jgi:peptidoglycan/LPS O-acetylase OafA/YrhL